MNVKGVGGWRMTNEHQNWKEGREEVAIRMI